MRPQSVCPSPSPGGRRGWARGEKASKKVKIKMLSGSSKWRKPVTKKLIAAINSKSHWNAFLTKIATLHSLLWARVKSTSTRRRPAERGVLDVESRIDGM